MKVKLKNNKANKLITGKIFRWIVPLTLILIFASGCGNNASDESQPSESDTTKISKINDLNQSIEDQPKNDSLFHERARAYLQRGKINEALSDINEAIALNSGESRYLLTLSDVYFAMGQLKKTQQTLQKVLINDQDNVDAMLKMAELNLYRKTYDKAFGFLNQAMKIEPENARIYFLSGMVNKDKGDTSKARRDFHRATENRQEYYEAWIQLGLIASRKNDSLAEFYYQNALKIRPESEEAHYNLGMFYQENEKYQKAINTYNQLLDINPQHKHAYYNLGYIHLTGTGKYKKAERYFRQVLDLDSSYVDAVYNLGSSLEQQGKLDEARKQYKKTLELEENYSLGIEGMNRLDQKQGR